MNNEKKLVPKLRFPEFTHAWEQRKLGDLANIRRGASPRPIQDPKWFDNDSHIGWLRISDVTEQKGRITSLEQKLSVLGQEKTLVLREPNLILSIAATVGKPVINYIPTGIHDGFIVFLDLKTDMEFMYQWLESYQSQWQKFGQPGSQVNINSDLVKEQIILVPEIEEQQKIGTFFTALDRYITIHQRKLENVKKLKAGLLQKMFPKNDQEFPEIRFPEFTYAWEQRKLGEILKIKSGMSQKNVEDPNGIYPILATGGEIGRTNVALYDKESVLIGRKGTIDKPYYMNTPFWTVDTLFYSELKKNISGLFVYDLFQIIKWKNYDTSTGVPSLTSSTIHNIDVKIPQFQEQQKIGAFFTALDRYITIHQRKLENMQKLKKSLLQQMFV